MLLWLVVAAVAGYQIFGAIYNIYFHPLASFPGPKLWIAFPVLRRISAATGNLDRELIKFHQRFGEVVRFTDDSLSFTTAQAWKDIYGYGHGSKQWPKEVSILQLCRIHMHSRDWWLAKLATHFSVIAYV